MDRNSTQSDPCKAHDDAVTVAVPDRLECLHKQTGHLALRQPALAMHVRVQVLATRHTSK